MARPFRFFLKKRGARRTGSNRVGIVGEAVFFVVLFLIGFSGLLLLLVSMVVRGWPTAKYFPTLVFEHVSAQILEKRLLGNDEQQFQPQLLVAFEYEGKPHKRWAGDAAGPYQREQAEEILRTHLAGESVNCWVDAENRATVVFHRPVPWGFYLAISVFVLFILIGAYGVLGSALRVGTSAERRAAMARKAADLDLMGDGLPAEEDFPTIPRATNLTNSPGTRLKYRLPAQQSPGWRLFALALLMLACDCLAGAFVVVAVQQHLSGSPRWFLTMFSLPVAALGVWATYHFLRELVGVTWIGPTSVEISQLPIFPGQHYEVYVNQAGALEVKHLRVSLSCDEETIYLQGTDVRRDQQRVFQQELLSRREFEIDAATPFEDTCPLQVPAEAMHSYKSQHGSISWKLVVEVEAAGWPGHIRSFPLVVYPPAVEPTSDDN